MTRVFLTVLNMSVAASIVAAAVMLVRIPLKKAPKIFSYALWAVVFVRLICPFSPESPAGLMPPVNPGMVSQLAGALSASPFNTISGADRLSGALADNPARQQSGNMAVPVNTADPEGGLNPEEGISPVSENNSGAGSSLTEAAGSAAGIGQVTGTGRIPGTQSVPVVMIAVSGIWLSGLVWLVLYHAAGYIRLKRKVYDATRVRDNIFETDKIPTAFVMGFVRPKIFVPTTLGGEQFDFILKHEQVHVRRYDYLIKPLAFFILAVHWFNPIAWVSYYLMSKDMEMSCDEAVLRQEDCDSRQVYSRILVSLYTHRPGLVSPLAFGEGSIGDMKARIKNVLNFRRTPRWAMVVCSSLTLLFTAGFMTSQPQSQAEEQPAGQPVQAEVQAEVPVEAEAGSLTDSYYSAQSLRPYHMMRKSIFKGMLRNGWLSDLEEIENPVWDYDTFTAYQVLDQDLNPVPAEEELYYCTFTADGNRQGYVVVSYTGDGMGRALAAETSRAYDLKSDLELVMNELEHTDLDLQTASASRVQVMGTGQQPPGEAILFTDQAGHRYLYHFDKGSFAAMQADNKTFSQIRRTDSLTENFAVYEPFGVRYDAAQDVVYYNGERVRLFVEFLSDRDNEITYAFELCYQDRDSAGTLYLEAYRDDHGRIAGIRPLDSQVADYLLEVTDRAYTDLEKIGDGESGSEGNYRFLTMDGVQIIDDYGIIARDITKDKVSQSIKQWTEDCDRKQGAYTMTVESAEGYTTYVYYNGGGRYPWNMEVTGEGLKINLFSDTGLMTADGYYLMYLTAPKEYNDIRLYLDDTVIR